MFPVGKDLLSPSEAARQLPWLVGELDQDRAGPVGLEYGAKDARFKDPTWTAKPGLPRAGHTYRLFEEWAGRMVGAVDASWERKAGPRICQHHDRSLAPPIPDDQSARAQARVETGGRSLVKRQPEMLRDMAAGGLPKMVDRDALKVGEQLLHAGRGRVPRGHVRAAAVPRRRRRWRSRHC